MRRRTFLASLAVMGTPNALRAQDAGGEAVLIGVSGPLTGQYAQYGAQWKRGFDLALDHANAQGGVKGKKLAYVFEDSQSDPRQSVAIAQKFVGNPAIVMELGDFSSAASMAASPIYQRGGLVQFGFTNSHPDFTKGGDYMWSDAPNQADDMPHLAEYAINGLGLKKLAILYINGDWGRTSQELMLAAAKQRGASVVASEGYLPEASGDRNPV
ncbi:MAG: ABC transporter substrate-binding protein [Hyphomicrobiales bacterium]